MLLPLQQEKRSFSPLIPLPPSISPLSRSLSPLPASGRRRGSRSICSNLRVASPLTCIPLPLSLSLLLCTRLSLNHFPSNAFLRIAFIDTAQLIPSHISDGNFEAFYRASLANVLRQHIFEQPFTRSPILGNPSQLPIRRFLSLSCGRPTDRPPTGTTRISTHASIPPLPAAATAIIRPTAAATALPPPTRSSAGWGWLSSPFRRARSPMC